MTVRRRVLVSGRVQGVFYRDTCRRRASEKGVAGFVLNRPDGRVEAVFESEEDQVAEMIDWMRGGPPSAEVEDIEISQETPEGLTSFEVR